jgi:hypothetical protein
VDTLICGSQKYAGSRLWPAVLRTLHNFEFNCVPFVRFFFLSVPKIGAYEPRIGGQTACSSPRNVSTPILVDSCPFRGHKIGTNAVSSQSAREDAGPS